MEEALEKHMPDGTSWTHPEGGNVAFGSLCLLDLMPASC